MPRWRKKAANVAYNKSMFESRFKGMYEMSRQSNLAILLGIDDVSQMLLFAEKPAADIGA